MSPRRYVSSVSQEGVNGKYHDCIIYEILKEELKWS